MWLWLCVLTSVQRYKNLFLHEKRQRDRVKERKGTIDRI